MSVKFIIPCKEANHVCDKTQYNEGSFWEKIKLNLHLLYCRACRKYSSQNGKLTKVMNPKPIALAPSAKEKLQVAFNKELANHQ